MLNSPIRPFEGGRADASLGQLQVLGLHLLQEIPICLISKASSQCVLESALEEQKAYLSLFDGLDCESKRAFSTNRSRRNTNGWR